MKRIFPLFFLLIFLCGCGGAATQSNKETSTVYAMDTVMTLTAYAPESGAENAVGAALEAAESEILRLEKMLSVTDEDSEIYLFNHGDQEALSIEAARLAAIALGYAEKTAGAYDPTVYPLMELWGFYGEEPAVPEKKALEEALSRVGYDRAIIVDRRVSLPEGFGLDLGGIAKGYTAETVLYEMMASGVDTAIISLGGNVAFMGKKPDGSSWNVLVEDPKKNGEYLGTLRFQDSRFAQTHVVTSGGYERNFEENGESYHHILDTETGYPAQSGLLSVTIITGEGAVADALSTALYVMGLEKAMELWKTSGLDFDMVLYNGQTVYVTPGVTLDSEYPVQEVAR